MSKEAKVLQAAAANFDGCYKKKHRSRILDIKRETVYNDIINRIGNNIFKWEGLPKEFTKSCSSMLIELAVNCGVAAIYKVPAGISPVNSGRWTCTPIEWTGQLRNDGTAEHFITHGTDYAVTDQQLSAYAIIKNDPYMSCEYDVSEWFASMLCDTDIAQRALIRWSRMTPIVKAGNGMETGQMESTLKRVYEGEPWAVISDNTKLITGSPTSRDDNILRLTDESAIERMHFLSEFHYELVRRICNLYNYPFHTTAKSAQNLESEVHNTDVFSQALSDLRYEERQNALDDIHALGEEWQSVTVRYGETVEKENEIIDSNVEEEKAEAAAADGEPESEPESDAASEPEEDKNDR